MEPALPLDEAGRYVAAAYVVFVTLIVVYVGIMAVRTQRLRQRISELAERAERRGDEAEGDGRAVASGEPAPGEAERAGERSEVAS